MLGWSVNHFTQILAAIEAGTPQATEQLLPAVYAELRLLAHRQLAEEKPGNTLDATALVNEVYLRLLGTSPKDKWENRAHFFSAAAEAMRRILIESARRKRTLKRGGVMPRSSVDVLTIPAPLPDADILALDEALQKFAQIHPEKAELVKLRYFAGLTLEEAARVLQISPSTADRHWAFARAWLHREITLGSANPSIAEK